MNKDEQWLLQEKYGGEKSSGFFTDLARLAEGEPLAYVIGSVPFLNCTIYLDSHPLIPRPETEFWVEKAIENIRTFCSNERHGDKNSSPRQDLGLALGLASGIKILDLCAGSGAIGVAVAHALPNAHVTFGELEQAHYSTINRTIGANKIASENCTVVIGDLFENIEGTFDYILTNPPYIDPALDRTQTSVKDFEPHEALYGGKDGMRLIAKIVEQALLHLKSNGQLWIEHEPEQVEAIASLAKQSDFETQTHNDQYKVPRYSVLNMAK